MVCVEPEKLRPLQLLDMMGVFIQLCVGLLIAAVYFGGENLRKVWDKRDGVAQQDEQNVSASRLNKQDDDVQY